MAAVVGIDLGTSNTVVARADVTNASAIVDPGTGQALIPSLISFHPSKMVLVGYPAKERRIIDSRNTIFGVKRLIGRAWGTPEVEEARKRLPFELRRGRNHAVQVLAREELYSLPEISAFVLRKAKQVAEASLGCPITRAVITVPANFNDLQREATKLAGALAGLDVVRILNEPTAAALAYGFDANADQRVLVYDFGGGTFDVTLLHVSKGVFRVLATAGDMFLGGEDIDTALAHLVSEAFLRKHYYDPRANRETFQLVRDAAEAMKMQLSQHESAALDVQDIMVGLGGKVMNFEFEMKRSELTKLVTPLVDRTLDVCLRALAIAKWRPEDVQQVILVGGSTRLSAVQERIAEFFARQPVANDSPFDAVAVGAAIHALSLDEGNISPATAAIARAARRAALPPGATSQAPPPMPPPARQNPPELPAQGPMPPVRQPTLGQPAAPYAALQHAPPPFAPQQQAFTPGLFAPQGAPPPRRALVNDGPRFQIPVWVWLLLGFLVALVAIVVAGVRLVPSPH